VERARALVPQIRERARRTEELRTLPVETVTDLRDAGMFRFFQPSRFGGYEMDWGIQVDLGHVIGQACGSTAWIVSVVCSHAIMVGRFPGEAQEEVWGEGDDVLIATGSARTRGRVKPTSDGFLLHGTWRFSSGVDHADWAIVAAPVDEDEENDGPPPLIQCLIPASDYRIEDDWFVSGLRGTGSKRIVIDEDVFVPRHRTIGFRELLAADPPGAAVNESYLYRMEFGPYFGTSLFGPILGAAHGALSQYVDTTTEALGAIFANRIGEMQSVQLRLAESAAEINAATLLADRILTTFRERGREGKVLTPRERVESMRDRAYLTRLCVDAVHRLVRQMGARGLSDDNPVQRHFRDLSAMAAQIGLNWDRNLGAYGKWALDLPTGDPAIDAELPAEPSPAAVE
jgi:3-hydroxy-9,10-secoandrosta-1,3,5(10)-triene-9,17-dione monooxygenase